MLHLEEVRVVSWAAERPSCRMAPLEGVSFDVLPCTADVYAGKGIRNERGLPRAV